MKTHKEYQKALIEFENIKIIPASFVKQMIDLLMPTFQELVEKEKPMKPEITIHNGYCRKCKEAFGRERVLTNPQKWLAYCPVCGQKIDWSDEE